MGLKKYEIITVGSDKRVRALRSWQVGDRYVNIGDVGGIVYDEKTLSQDGACWLFRGNFGFPGARIGGDSIVDVGEASLSTAGTPAVDILGSSVVVGSKLQFESELTTADAIVLTAADFEQGTITYAKGLNWETWKTPSARSVRLKAPIFAGGTSVTVKCAVPGYSVQAYVLDRDGIGVTVTNTIESGVDVTLSVPAGQYFVLRLAKNPAADIAPADATAAAITFTGTYETKLSIIDSRVEINPATSTGTATIKPGGFYIMSPGASYPGSVIRNSRVVINGHATANRVVRLISEFIGCNVAIDATTTGSQGVGVYSNVKNLTFTGLPVATGDVAARSIIQATDCDNFAVSPTIFPGLVAQAANMPFIFQGCNVPNGLFYRHAQIKNTYVNIDFAKAQADLGKLVSGRPLISSEVEGMYRCLSATGAISALVEAHDSVKSLNIADTASSYGTTIYKDAYFSGLFDFAGTNVFGNKVRSHPLAQVLNVAPRAVQGGFNTTTIPPTAVPEQLVNTVMNVPLRINGANGLKVENVPTGVRFMYAILDANLKFIQNSGWQTGAGTIPASLLQYPYAMITFNSTSGTISPADLAGVTVTVYNGCKIMNTGETAVSIKGNFRVEGNATLINCSLIGSGYFGGNCVASSLFTAGSVFMKDNAKFTKTAGTNVIRNLRITENGTVKLGDVTWLGVVQVADNAILSPTAINLTECDIFMSGNASITSSVTIAGMLRMKDNAKVNAGVLTTYGDITLCGSYNQTAARSWAGKRVIDNENAPEYDNNVKTQYDF